MNFKLVLCLVAVCCGLAVAKKVKVQEDKPEPFADAVLFTDPSLFKEETSADVQVLSTAIESARQFEEESYSPYYYQPEAAYYPPTASYYGGYPYADEEVEPEDGDQETAPVPPVPGPPPPVPPVVVPPVPGHPHHPPHHYPGYPYPHYPGYPHSHYPPRPYPPHKYPHYPYPYPYPYPRPPKPSPRPPKESTPKHCKKLFPFGVLCY